MSIERVKTYFKKYGMEDKIMEFDVSSATVELAAAALHCEPRRIAKTLSFLVDGQAVLIVTAGDRKVWDKSKDAITRRSRDTRRTCSGRRLSVCGQ